MQVCRLWRTCSYRFIQIALFNSKRCAVLVRKHVLLLHPSFLSRFGPHHPLLTAYRRLFRWLWTSEEEWQLAYSEPFVFSNHTHQTSDSFVGPNAVYHPEGRTCHYSRRFKEGKRACFPIAIPSEQLVVVQETAPSLGTAKNRTLLAQ